MLTVSILSTSLAAKYVSLSIMHTFVEYKLLIYTLWLIDITAADFLQQRYKDQDPEFYISLVCKEPYTCEEHDALHIIHPAQLTLLESIFPGYCNLPILCVNIDMLGSATMVFLNM